jgi:NAD(P)-dependent dehydrogenase (short-subunit alcohol dehydrogenase family)
VSATLAGRRLLVIGASAGIGRAVGQAAVRAGADAVLVGRRRERLDEVIADAGGGHALVADIADADDCTALVASAVDALGEIDALLVCSGTSGLSLLRDTAQPEWRQVFDVNVIGPSLVTTAALPHLASGAFVGYLSSEAVGRPRHGLVHYSASKAALEETIRGWRTEQPEVRFCCICVGATVGTEFARDFETDVAASLFPSWVAQAQMAAGMMEVDDVGRAVVELVDTALAHPDIDLQDVTLRPPGPLMESADVIMETFEENKAGQP